MVVLHYTAMETATYACERLCDPCAEVSAHYVISEQGHITQLVDENMRAWHAGAGAWGDVVDVNSHSIGIELANLGTHPFPAPQMDALEILLVGIQDWWAIPAARVIGHSDMAPDRKFDPGLRFDWRRLALGGFSVWPSDAEPVVVDWESFKSYATTFGYRPAQDTVAGWAQVLSAFRMRFMPHKTGEIDGRDMGLMKTMAVTWPCHTEVQAPLNKEG